MKIDYLTASAASLDAFDREQRRTTRTLRERRTSTLHDVSRKPSPGGNITARERVDALLRRPAGHPLGTVAEPLPMLDPRAVLPAPMNVAATVGR